MEKFVQCRGCHIGKSVDGLELSSYLPRVLLLAELNSDNLVRRNPHVDVEKLFPSILSRIILSRALLSLVRHLSETTIFDSLSLCFRLKIERFNYRVSILRLTVFCQFWLSNLLLKLLLILLLLICAPQPVYCLLVPWR